MKCIQTGGAFISVTGPLGARSSFPVLCFFDHYLIWFSKRGGAKDEVLQDEDEPDTNNETITEDGSQHKGKSRNDLGRQEGYHIGKEQRKTEDKARFE